MGKTSGNPDFGDRLKIKFANGTKVFAIGEGLGLFRSKRLRL